MSRLGKSMRKRPPSRRALSAFMSTSKGNVKLRCHGPILRSSSRNVGTSTLSADGVRSRGAPFSPSVS